MRHLLYVSYALVLCFFTLACENSAVEEFPNGAVSGRVVNAATGAPLANVTVYISGFQSATQVTSDSFGNFTIPEIEYGPRTIRADLNGFTSDELSVEVPGYDTLTNQNLSLLPSLFAENKYAVILTWNTEVADLDSHLYVPNGDPFREIFYGDSGDSDGVLDAAPFAGLDLDDVDGEGPETITVAKTGAVPYYNGTYRYYVHNFSQDPDITVSSATVKVFDDGVLVKTYNIPVTGTGLYWHVFDLSGSGVFTDFNELSDTPPATP